MDIFSHFKHFLYSLIYQLDNVVILYCPDISVVTYILSNMCRYENIFRNSNVDKDVRNNV